MILHKRITVRVLLSLYSLIWICNNNIKIDLKEVGGKRVSIPLVQNRGQWWALLNTVRKFRVSSNEGNGLISRATISF
jgi:hypothetical protein